MATYIVLLGPPGLEKAPRPNYLRKQWVWLHISSGDIFRENLKNETELGKLAAGLYEPGRAGAG